MKNEQKHTVYWIEGDGIGRELWQAARPVLTEALRVAYGGEKQLAWVELLAGEKAVRELGVALPEETLQFLSTAKLAMKGPLGTPVGGGFRSLNVALRQCLDLYACIRPVRHFPGVASPVKHPERVNMIIFRENTEDLYTGIEYAAHSAEAKKLIDFLHETFGLALPAEIALGIKPMSEKASKRLIRRALTHALEKGLPVVTLVHKGNIMKYTEGAFRQWGYELAREEFSQSVCTEQDMTAGKVVLNDRIADAMFQEALLNPERYSILATPNLNGDYLSDAVAAQVGGLGLAPGVNMSDQLAFFEATHGTAPALAGKDKANPGSLILCGAMLFEHLGWSEAAQRLQHAVETTIQNKTVTVDLAEQMDGAKILGCRAFGEKIAEALAYHKD